MFVLIYCKPRHTCKCQWKRNVQPLQEPSCSSMLQKLNTLIETSNRLNMQLHPAKSKFFSVNTCDKETFITQNIAICHTRYYMYLGSPISNAPMHKQVGEQMSLKQCHARKFGSFLRKNSEAPFAVKRAIWESALISSILYGCETCMTNSLKTVEQLYQHTLKDQSPVSPNSGFRI